MNQKPTLIIISSDKKIKKSLVATMNEMLGHEILIKGYSIEEGIPHSQKADLVLTSGPITHAKIKHLFPNTPIIPSKRVITGYNLEQVIMLPKGKQVLVATLPKFASEETIKNLIDLGITHVEYIPYWEGRQIDEKEIDTAISPGMPHLIPAKIKHKIDIGERTINLSTFLEVLLQLKLDLKYLDVFEKNYTRLLMKSSRKMHDILQQSERLRANQTIILNEIEEGILSVNEQNQVIIANPAMFKLFGKSPDILENPSIQEIMGRLDDSEVFLDCSSNTVKSSDVIYSHQGKQIVCTKNTVSVGDEKHVIYTFREVSQIQKLEQRVRSKLHEKGYVAKHNFEDIWGHNQRMIILKEKALRFAQTEETILITGESGTGKELLSQAIHLNSQRKDGPFVAINFAAIPENLVESELFGYEDGAFTGARKGGKPGFFELAHGGTLLLDEIGDAPLNIQARLLRVLEEKEIMRLGGSRIIPVDIRLIAATNKNLMDYVKRNLFRADLFYRLNVLTLETLPVREFKQEIPAFLEKQLLYKFNIKMNILPDVIHCLLKYDWPGNMRELRNVVDYMYHSALEKDLITIENVPAYIKNQVQINMFELGKEQFKELKRALEIKGDLREIAAVIEIYYQNKPVGRNTLIECVKRKGIILSEGKAKKYINLLENLGLICIGKTKQGSLITEMGRNLYDYLKYIADPISRQRD